MTRVCLSVVPIWYLRRCTCSVVFCGCERNRLTKDSNLFITLVHLLVFYYLPVSKKVICCILNSLLHNWFYLRVTCWCTCASWHNYLSFTTEKVEWWNSLPFLLLPLSVDCRALDNYLLSLLLSPVPLFSLFDISSTYILTGAQLHSLIKQVDSICRSWPSCLMRSL